MANYLGVSGCVAVNSGTSALHLALLSSGVGCDDNVIVPVLTFIATANAVSYTRAKPVFVDVDRETWTVSYIDAIYRLNLRTKAIIPVNIYGVPSYGSNINLIYIGDAAESVGSGSYWHNDIQCYSFNGNKTMSTGSGGLIVGDNIEEVRELADVGRKDGEFNSIGYNYRMNGMQAEMGLIQLPYLDKWVAKKRRFNQIYREQLSDIIQFQEPTPGSNPSWWFTAGLFPEGTDIPGLQNKLAARGVPTRRIFQPLNQLKPYLSNERFPVAEDIYNRGLCLPSSVLNSEKDIMKVCNVIMVGS